MLFIINLYARNVFTLTFNSNYKQLFHKLIKYKLPNSKHMYI